MLRNENAIALLKKGVEFINNLDHKNAINSLREALKIDPMFPEAYFYLGIAFQNGGYDRLANQNFLIACALGYKAASEVLMIKKTSLVEISLFNKNIFKINPFQQTAASATTQYPTDSAPDYHNKL